MVAGRKPTTLIIYHINNSENETMDTMFKNHMYNEGISRKIIFSLNLVIAE